MSDQNVSTEKFKNNPNDIIRTRTRYLTAEQVDILQNILSKEIDSILNYQKEEKKNTDGFDIRRIRENIERF